MPTCFKCGAPNATVHLTRILNGVSTQLVYCESCFDLKAFRVLRKKTVTPENVAQIQAEYEKFGKTPKIISFSSIVKEICERDPRFAPEAYEFVQRSLNHVFKSIQPQGHARHITARELVDGCQDYARETWGTSAKAQLKAWGIKTSSHIGDIVFLLIENHVLGKRPEDNRSDFDSLSFLPDNT
jgi:uncharacterized repeat protein (TIGR04138 family)